MAQNRWSLSGDEEQLLSALAEGLADAVSTPTEPPPDSSNLLYAYLLPLFATSVIAVCVTWFRYRADVSLVMQHPARLRRPGSRAASRHSSPKPPVLKKEE